jgi:hypothetical protein
MLDHAQILHNFLAAVFFAVAMELLLGDKEVLSALL